MTTVTQYLPRNEVVRSVILAIVLTGFSYVVGIALGWIHDVNYLEAFAVFTSYSCTYLCVMQKRINYPIGAISTAAYAVLFWQQGLYLSMALNLYLTPALLYGWIRWRRDSNARPVTWVKGWWWIAYAAIGAVGVIGGGLISSAFGGQMAFWDAFILAGTVVAQFLMDNKKLENWIIWALVDIVAIGVYFQAGLPLAGFQYIFFLANAAWGWIAWAQSRKTNPEFAQPAASVVES